MSAPPPIAAWAGVECTVNRVGDRWSDQLARTGHADRFADLDLLIGLGVRAVRYPVLWERTWPDPGRAPDWSWAAPRLDHFRAHNVTVVAGLLHHGSGPAGTGLTDPAFPARLADYAARVAARFPWLSDYTPVNEPLTTARFAGLYGHWYPHGTSDTCFARALVNQCRGVALAMRAIRRVNPAARLVQTEDLGQTHAAPGLESQARFENDRRWLSWDLLSGRVDRGHPLWGYLLAAGIAERELDRFVAEPCPPDLVGVNYYATSERYLDSRVDHHPPECLGGNREGRYADVAAVRAAPGGVAGLAGLLGQVWARYRTPVAVTEAHLGCGREEQLRWLAQTWREARAAAAAGVAVEAVTTWSAFGALDWDSLVTAERGHYEPGPFDARSTPPRPTALAELARELAAGGAGSHPVLASPGWWQRPGSPATRIPGRPILIVGRNRLGRALARACCERGLAHRVVGRAGARAALARGEAWAVIRAARGVPLAGSCRRAGAKLLVFARVARPRHNGVLRVVANASEWGEPATLAAALDLLVDGEDGAWDPAGPTRLDRRGS